MNNQCNIIQKYNQNSKILYKTIKEITGKKTTKLCVLKDKKGEIITEEKDIKEKCKINHNDFRRISTQVKLINDDSINNINRLKLYRVKLKEKWKEYTEKLYKKDETIKEVFTATTFVQEPTITEAEVANAIKEILTGKSPGIDEIPAELIR